MVKTTPDIVAFDDFYRGKRVLVTGHTGFKGSWLCEWLLKLGAEVSGYSLDIPSEPSHFKLLELNSRIRNDLRGDIRDFDSIQDAFAVTRPEIVFHLAAQSLVRASYDDPKFTFDTNIGGTVNVLESIRRTSFVKAALVVTSDKCYENQERDYAYREGDPLGGKDPYSASKGAVEIVFSSYFRSLFQGANAARLASARAGNVIGGGDWATDRIIPDCVRAWVKHQSVAVRNPASTRPWQHVLEPLGGYLWLVARLMNDPASTVGQSFNFGPTREANQPVSVLVEHMQQTWSDARWHLDSIGSGNKLEAGLLNLDCEKAKTRLKWEPTLSFRETVEMTASWYRDFYSGEGRTADQIAAYGRLAAQRGRRWAVNK